MIEQLEEIAVAAGLEIMRLVRHELAFEKKPDGSERCNADIAAEKLILAGLRSKFPDVPIVAEESVDDGHLPDDLDGTFFLVDPLDGTRELKAGNGQFAVNIALISDQRPVLGVMYAPAENRIYSTRDGRAVSALVSSSGNIGPADYIRCRPAFNATRGIVSRSRAASSLAYLDDLGIQDVVQYGSTLKFCKVAEGYADIYVSAGETREWDTAAGEAILIAAGGEVLSLADSLPIRYGKRLGDRPFLNPGFIARARST